MVFFVGLFFFGGIVRWGTGNAGYNRYVQYYVQIPCQTGENRQKYQVKPLNSENFTWSDMKKIENIEDITGYTPLISYGACSRCSSPVSGGCTCSQRRCPR